MNKRLEELLRGHLGDGLSETEWRELGGYLEDPLLEGELGELLGEAFAAHVSEGPELSVAQQGMVLGNIYASEKGRVVARWRWPWLAAAVLLLVFVGIGTYLYRDGSLLAAGYERQLAQVRPGSDGATLTLGNGRKLVLSEAGTGELAVQPGVRVLKDADGSLVYELSGDGVGASVWNTLATGRGQTYRVRLPDGSQVWLNAGSSLRYQSGMSAERERRVELSGEGYFEVARDVSRPFVVASGKQEVTVLGTHFNVSAYSGESLVTTLVEGKVKVALEGRAGMERLLSADQQAVVSERGISVREVEALDMVAWKDGLFVFDDEALPQVMRKLSRWYNIEIDYSRADAAKRFGGSVSRYEDMAVVLAKLEQTGGVHFRVEEGRVVVTR